MKRIVLLTDPDRVDAGLLERLQRVFPECPVEIVAVTEDAGRVIRRHPATRVPCDTMDGITG